jgi:hypothetical protein
LSLERKTPPRLDATGGRQQQPGDHAHGQAGEDPDGKICKPIVSHLAHVAFPRGALGQQPEDTLQLILALELDLYLALVRGLFHPHVRRQ